MTKFKTTLSRCLYVTSLILSMLVASLCSSNVNALEFPEGWVAEWAIQSPNYRIQTTGSGWGSWTTAGTNSIPNLPNHVYRVQVRNTDTTGIPTYPNRIIAIGMSARNCTFTGVTYGDNSWFRFIGQDVSTAGARADSGDNVFNATYYFYSSKNNTGSTTAVVDFYPDIFCTADNTSTWFKVNSYVQFSSNSVKDYTSALNTINSNIGNFRTDFNNQINDVKTNYLDVIIENQQQQSQEQQQNRQEGQQAQQNADTQGNQSSQQATTDGQSLLAAFQSFLGALTNARPGNCNIDMDTGYIDFGEVNLCSISPPPAFQAISSIVVIGFAVPLSIACARKIIELFRSFQS